MATASLNKRWTWSDITLLLLAAGAHGLLLLLPLRPALPPVPISPVVSVRLLPWSPAEPVTDKAAAEKPPVPPPLPAVTTPPAHPPSHTDAASKPVDSLTADAAAQQSQDPEQDSQISWSANALLHAISELDSSLQDDSPAWRLGRPMRSPAPENWQRGTGAQALQPADNLFNGMTVAGQVEIIDRWRAADGSHNVVINLPNGTTVCGRAQAFNPMQPLVEPVMMFRECGGGGPMLRIPRTLSAREREQLSAGMQEPAG